MLERSMAACCMIGWLVDLLPAMSSPARHACCMCPGFDKDWSFPTCLHVCLPARLSGVCFSRLPVVVQACKKCAVCTPPT